MLTEVMLFPAVHRKSQNCMYVVVYYSIPIVLNIEDLHLFRQGGEKHHETYIGYGPSRGRCHAADILGGYGF